MTVTPRSRRAQVVSSLWLLTALPPFGLTLWAGFLYVDFKPTGGRGGYPELVTSVY